MSVGDVIAMWDRPDAPLHPSIGTDLYWDSAVASGHLAWFRNMFPPPRTVLDFACGDGRLLVHLREAGYDVEGYDTCAASLARLAEHCPEAIAFNTLPDKAYDLVLMVAVLIHYDHVDGMSVVEQAWKMVAPGGYLYAGVPYGDEVKAGSLGLNIWPVGSIVLPDAEVVLQTLYPCEHQVFRKVAG